MRAAVSKSYEIGSEYVTSRVGLSAASFLTHGDIDNIKNLSIEFTNKFFGRVQLSLDNTIRSEFYKQQPADSTLNPNFITTSVAISATSKAMAEGSRLKAKSILQTNKSDNVSLLQAATATTPTKKKAQKKKKQVELLPAIDPLSEEDLLITNVGLGFAGGISLATLAASALQENQWVWITAADDRVCEICESFEGEVYTMDDIDLAPVPVDDSHNNCRCRLLLL